MIGGCFQLDPIDDTPDAAWSSLQPRRWRHVRGRSVAGNARDRLWSLAESVKEFLERRSEDGLDYQAHGDQWAEPIRQSGPGCVIRALSMGKGGWGAASHHDHRQGWKARRLGGAGAGG